MSILYRAMAIDCRNCDKRSEETISHVDKAMAGCSFYHIKSLDSNIAHSNKLNISLFLPKCLAILISPLAPSDWFSCFIFLMLCVNAMCDCRLMLPVLARSLEDMFNQWHILLVKTQAPLVSSRHTHLSLVLLLICLLFFFSSVSCSSTHLSRVLLLWGPGLSLSVCPPSWTCPFHPLKREH